MAKTKISDFNSNPALNTDIDSINIAEGCSPSGINDAIRELMSQLKDWQAGTSNDPMVIGSSGSLTLNQGTANGVAYLNGSKVVTSGSALTFDGTNLGVGTASPSGASGTTFAINGGAGQTRIALKNTASGDTSTDGFQIALLSDGVNVVYQNRESGYQAWEGNGNELMRLTSTGLGIGTSSPTTKLDVNGNIAGGSLNVFGSGVPANGINNVATNTLGLFTNSTERARIDSSGNLLVGTTAVGNQNADCFSFSKASGYVAINHVNGKSSGSGYISFGYNSSEIGSITQTGTTAVLYNTTSDQRLKENIQDADSASSLIDSLKVRKFDWKTDNTHQRYGFVAQELVTVAPEAVHQPEDSEQMMAVDYSKLVPMLVKEIQSLRKRLANAGL